MYVSVYLSDLWIRYDESYYKAYPTPLPWYEARAVCMKCHGLLAVIETSAEREFVDGLADDAFRARSRSDGGFWIGGSSFYERVDTRNILSEYKASAFTTEAISFQKSR